MELIPDDQSRAVKQQVRAFLYLLRQGSDFVRGRPRLLATSAGFGFVVAAAVVVRAYTTDACPPVTTIERISVAVGGGSANGRSSSAAPSADGCVIAFRSAATNLLQPSDGNNAIDVFVADRIQGTLVQVPGWFAAAPPYPRGTGFAPAVTSDGSLIAFGSDADNLICGDGNHSPDLFVADRTAMTTASLSFAQPLLGAGPAACVEYEGGGGVNPQSLAPSFDLDARFVVFSSESDSLLDDPRLDQNSTYDVFIADRSTDPPIRELVSQMTVGSQPGHSGNGPSKGGVVNADGCRVAFYSKASLLVAGDRNERQDVFWRDRCAGQTVMVSVTPSGLPGNGASPGDESAPAISGDGNRVVFSSVATNLVENDSNGASDVFVRDIGAGLTALISRGLDGANADGPSTGVGISANGRFVVFQSLATNLVPDDTNGRSDVFLGDLDTGEIRLVSRAASGEEGNDDSFAPAISADGKVIVFESDATNLVPDGGPGAGNIFAVANVLAQAEPTPTPTVLPPTPAVPTCPGDCNGDGAVTIEELVTGVNIALELAPVETCPAMDRDGSGTVTIEEIIMAVNAALSGCPPT